MQTTSNILMIRPVRFGFNAETAASNAFQQDADKDHVDINEAAQEEFDTMVAALKEAGVNIIIVEDTLNPHTPDSIFPNNWISFHANGSIILYPMLAASRRKEKRKDIFEMLEQKGFEVDHIMDLSVYEKENKFLEGTGSMVLDRKNKIAYACLSPRTDKEVLQQFSQHFGYRFISFHAGDKKRIAIYHTNVLMCIGDEFAAICAEAIHNKQEQKTVLNSLQQSGKEIILLSLDQLHHFAGNMLQLHNSKGEKIIVMSRQAFDSLEKDQIGTLNKYGKIIHPDLSTIEATGGGSARCMIAEIFLPEKK